MFMKNYVVIINCDNPSSEEIYYFENSSREAIMEWWEQYYGTYMSDYEWYAYNIWNEENEDYDEEKRDEDFYESCIYEAYYGSGQIEIIELTDENKEDFCIEEMEKII